MAKQAVHISYRLGGDDGVSVEARKWTRALQELDFETRRVAGEIEGGGQPDDLTLPQLAIDATEPVDEQKLREALDADLVIVDNLCSLPLNVGAARAVARATHEVSGRICFRHHDLPWQRRHLASLEGEFPPRVPGALHATINLRSRRELEARKHEHATTIHNYFDLTPPPGDRARTRAEFGFADDEFVLFQPARAIERKNIPGGLLFAQKLEKLAPALNLRYWLSGPAEDGYASTLDRILERAPVAITMGRAAAAADAYAAADLVVFPSTWEGFGNPVIESIAARRPCAAANYPVLAELTASGVRVFVTDRVDQVVRFLAEPPDVREQYYDVNLRRAAISFDIAQLPTAIDEAFANHGWLAW
jgi:mannosylglucosylglycerate synthase